MSNSDSNQTGLLGEPVEGWTRRPHPIDNPNFFRLQGHYCQLSVLNSSTDPRVIQGLFEVFKTNEDEHFKYLPYGPFKKCEEFLALIKEKERPESNTVFYTIFVDDKPVGFISFLRIDQEAGTIEIGSVNFSTKLTKTRAATEAVYLLLSLALDTFGYRRVEWKCNAYNLKSRRAAVRFGFQYEGTWLKALVCKGLSRDNSWYSIVDDEWAKIKEKYLNWLNPTNFNENGEQLTKLDAANAGQQSRQLQDVIV